MLYLVAIELFNDLHKIIESEIICFSLVVFIPFLLLACLLFAIVYISD